MFLLKDIFANEENFIDKEVEVAGWIKNSRFNNNIGFMEQLSKVSKLWLNQN